MVSSATFFFLATEKLQLLSLRVIILPLPASVYDAALSTLMLENFALLVIEAWGALIISSLSSDFLLAVILTFRYASVLKIMVPTSAFFMAALSSLAVDTRTVSPESALTGTEPKNVKATTKTAIAKTAAPSVLKTFPFIFTTSEIKKSD